MSDCIVEPGDKLHVITRRMFPEDLRRHFVGEVLKSSEHLCEARGYAFVFDAETNNYVRQPELRTRILSLGDAGHIVNRIPRDVNIGTLEYRFIKQRLVLTDMIGFSLDINEFGASS